MCESCAREFLALFSVFVKQKAIVDGNISFKDYASGIQLPDYYKLSVKLKNGNDITIFRNEAIIIFTLFCFSCQV